MIKRNFSRSIDLGGVICYCSMYLYEFMVFRTKHCPKFVKKIAVKIFGISVFCCQFSISVKNALILIYSVPYITELRHRLFAQGC
jgi:hypothetical protein